MHSLARSLALLSLGLATVGAGACAPDDMGPEPDVELLLEPPTLESIAPEQLAVGDEVSILAENLPDKTEASVTVHLDGTYVTATGQKYDFDGEIPVVVENKSVASFQFDHLYFDPNEAETGTWTGKAELVLTPKHKFGEPASDMNDDDVKVRSNPIDLRLRVGPSIVLDRLQSVEAQGCSDVTFSTNANHQIALGFRAIGLGVASEQNPWTFRMHFSSPALRVRYVKEDAGGGFQGLLGDAVLDDSVSTDAREGQNSLAVRRTSGDSLMLNPLSEVTTATINPPVEIGTNVFDEVVLGRLAAGALDSEYGRGSATIVLEVQTQDGRDLTRAITFEYFNEVEIAQTATAPVLVERYEPAQTCGCVPGGPNGTRLDYSEGESISKNRSLNFRWDQNVASSLGFTVGSFTPVIQATGNETWSQSFGVDVSEAVTSEKHKSLNVSREVIATWYGTCYRQLEEMNSTVDIIAHNACGASAVVGQAVLTDYNFSFDVAVGDSCPPQTDLPPAESFR